MRILSCLGITDGIIHQEARQEEQKNDICITVFVQNSFEILHKSKQCI